MKACLDISQEEVGDQSWSDRRPSDSSKSRRNDETFFILYFFTF